MFIGRREHATPVPDIREAVRATQRTRTLVVVVHGQPRQWLLAKLRLNTDCKTKGAFWNKIVHCMLLISTSSASWAKPVFRKPVPLKSRTYDSSQPSSEETDLMHLQYAIVETCNRKLHNGLCAVKQRQMSALCLKRRMDHSSCFYHVAWLVKRLWRQIAQSKTNRITAFWHSMPRNPRRWGTHRKPVIQHAFRDTHC